MILEIIYISDFPTTKIGLWDMKCPKVSQKTFTSKIYPSLKGKTVVLEQLMYSYW